MSITFIFINHPLSIGLILLIQTTIIAIITGLISHTLWFSYILFIIIIGGILVLFIYITRVASNEKFIFSNKLSLTITSIIFVRITFLLLDQFILYENTTTIDITNYTNNINFSLSIRKYFNFPLNSWIITLIVYLLLTLIAVVKITNITYGPLRQKL